MSWAYLDDGFDEHEKALAAGPLGIALFACGLTYCNRRHTGGYIVESRALRLVDFEGLAEPKEVIERLIRAGLWEQADGGYQVHDYAYWNRTAMREARSKARAKASLREQDPSDGSLFAGSSDLVVSNEEQNENKNTRGVKGFGEGGGVGGGTISFDDLWSLYPRKIGKPRALKSLHKALGFASIAEIHAGLVRWVQAWDRAGTDQEFIPHLSTWLNDCRWKDEPALGGRARSGPDYSERPVVYT